MEDFYPDSGFTKIVEHIPIGLAVFVNRNGFSRLYDANSYLCSLLEVDRNYIQGYDFSRFMQFVHPDDVIDLQNTTRRLLTNYEPISITFRFISKETHTVSWVKLEGQVEAEDDVTMVIYCCFENITKEIETQDRMMNHLEKYHAFISGAKMIIWEYDVPGRVFRSNDDSFERVNLPNVIEHVPQSVMKYIDPRDQEKAMDAFLQIESGMQQVTVDLWMNKDYFHTEACIRINFNVTYDKSASPLIAYAIAQDITAEKQEEKKYEEFLNESGVHNPNSRGTFHLNLSRNTCDYGINTSPLVSRLHSDGTADGFFHAVSTAITHPSDRENFESLINREKLILDFRNGDTQLDCSYRRIVESGENHWVHFFITLMQNPHSGDIEAITEAEDINEAVINQMLMQRISDMDYDYIGMIDCLTDKVVYYSNNAGLISDGLNHGRPFADVVDDFIMEHVLAVQMEDIAQKLTLDNIKKELEHAESYSVTYTQRNPDSSDSQKQIKYFWLDDTKTNIIEIQIDVTASYKQEQEQILKLQEAALAADNANAAKSNFLATMSHDMRTPLNGILGFTRLAQEATGKKQLKDYLNKIMISGEFLLDLINDTLDLSKIESGNIIITPAKINNNELLESLLTPVRASAEAKHINLVVNRDQEDDHTVFVDELHFRKIFLNLLSNAIKFTNPGGTVTFDIRRIDEVQSGYPVNVRIQVIDNGTGMSPEFIPKMFEPFTQETANDAVANNMGTGLGLNIVHHLVELMHGTIEVESTLGKGSCFTVYLNIPIVEGDATPKQLTDEGPIDLDGKTVLLCEDHPLNQEIVKTLLRKKRMEVLTAENGLLGAQTFAQSNPGEIHAILMDIRMPIMNGLEATKNIRALSHPNAQKIPIIALTANAYEDDVQAALDAGMNSHLSKPIEPLKLYQTLSKLIREASEAES